MASSTFPLGRPSPRPSAELSRLPRLTLAPPPAPGTAIPHSVSKDLLAPGPYVGGRFAPSGRLISFTMSSGLTCVVAGVGVSFRQADR